MSETNEQLLKRYKDLQNSLNLLEKEISKIPKSFERVGASGYTLAPYNQRLNSALFVGFFIGAGKTYAEAWELDWLYHRWEDLDESTLKELLRHYGIRTEYLNPSLKNLKIDS